MSACTHLLGRLPCCREDEHEGGDTGRGCVHVGMTAPDKHEQSSGGEG